jgi:hypothetical protein
MKWRHWSILIVLVLLNYIIFSTAFTQLSKQRQPSLHATRTPLPTYEILQNGPVGWVVLPTSTPWPTRTPITATPTPEIAPTAVVTATEVVIIPTVELPTEIPATATPPPATPTLQATPKPTSKPPTPKPTKKPPTPTSRPPQFTAEVIWDPVVAPNCDGPGIAKQSIIRDTGGNPINGAVVELNCYDNIWLSHPSGNPGEYDPGHYDFGVGQHSPQNWTCTARVITVNGQPVASSQVVTIQFDTNNCKPGGNGHQAATVNWTKNW